MEPNVWTHSTHYELTFGRGVWYPVEYGGEANEVIRYLPGIVGSWACRGAVYVLTMPGILCQNVDGLSSSLRACLLSILKIHASNPIFAACLETVLSTLLSRGVGTVPPLA